MSQPELLKKTARALDRLGVPFMLTGSLASSLLGEPRATHDIDLVVDLPAAQIDGLCREFPPPDYYVDRGAIERAITNRGMFNILDVREGDKVDFWLLTLDLFDQDRFRRRQLIDFAGVSLHVASPEDMIVMKLKRARDAGGSEQQQRDALRVYEVQRAALDVDYLQRWVHRLQLDEDWQRLLAAADPLD